MDKFSFVTVVLPVINETGSLRCAIDVLLRNSSSEVGEVLAIICDRTTDDEFVIRFNRRKDAMAAFQALLGLASSKTPMPYKELTQSESKG